MEDGSDLRRIANAAGCGYIEKRRKPYVAHMSGAGSAAMIYLQNNVFDEALERLRMIFDGHDDVIVSMSGGKDSTVLFRMALMVAQERGRLPLKVFWLDQEAEWQATVDYMQHIMELPEVTPYWYQIPFEFTNTLSPEKNFISVWNPEDKAIWIHPQHPLSIKENPSSENRFHELVNVLPSHCTDSENCAVLVGMRMTESLNRRVAITQHEARYKGVTWCKKKVGRCQVFWPIYDFTNDDIWTKMPDLPPVVCVVPLLSKKCQSGIIVPVKNRSGPTAQTQGRGRRDLEMIRANAQTRRKGDRIWESLPLKKWRSIRSQVTTAWS